MTKKDFTNLDWQELIKFIQQKATSETSKLIIGELKPLKSPDEARKYCEEILLSSEILKSGVRPHMESIDLFSTWFGRLKKNAVLKALEIKDVRHFCLEVVALSEALSLAPNKWSMRIKSSLMKAEEPLSAIDQIMTARGDIRSDASETLYRLFNEKENLARQIQSTLDRLVHDHKMDNYLQEKYVTTRDGRWVLPVKGGMQHFVPGVIHGASQTKQTVFMEPESIIPVNNRLRQIEVEIEDEIERLLTQLSQYLSSKVQDFESSRALLEECDIKLSEAQIANILNAQAVNFVEDKIELHGIKHPLLVLNSKNVVANTVQLDAKKSILLLSGPNAGGKTVLLKSIGLAAQMARCGLPICAEEQSSLPFFKEITIGIGDFQSVGEDLSTFAAHLKILNQAAKLKGSENLILVDEICGSTDPEEGSALARSFIESFSNNGVFAIVTSHLSPLKTGWSDDSRVINGSLEYDAQTGRPTYQFISGIPGESLAIQTAKRVGVEKHIIEKALETLSPATQARLSKLDEIEKLKSDINALREHLQSEIKKTNSLKSKYEKMLSQMTQEKEQLLEKTVKKAEKKVEELLTHAKVENVFKKHERLHEIKKELPTIVKGNQMPQQGSTQTPEDFGKKFPPGTKVFVPNLGKDAIIQSVPNSKGEVSVLAGSVRLNINWQELKTPNQPSNPTGRLVRQTGAASVVLVDHDKQIDLRGQTVDEALSTLEIELDRAANQKHDRIKIIHGHGTEALKKAVRSYLSRSVYVKKWKAASPEQGGDGATWVEIEG